MMKLLTWSLLTCMAAAIKESPWMDIHIVRKYDRKKVPRPDKVTGTTTATASVASHAESTEPHSFARLRSSKSELSAPNTRDVSDLEMVRQTDSHNRLLVENNGITSWSGMSVISHVPSDTCGAVGPSHYFQVVNNYYSIYSKTGTLLSGPNHGNAMFSAFAGEGDGPTACRTATHGDPTVQYDRMADRWVFTEFAWTAANDATGPYFQCLAVSQTSDPLGAYHYYAFEGRDGSNNVAFPDYGKIAIWPDAYYIIYVLFVNDVYAGPQVCAYNRANILAGGDADPYCVALGSNYNIMYAGDLDGDYADPATTIGNTNYITALRTSPTNGLEVYKMSYTGRTFTGPTILPVTSWNPVCSWYQRDCIDQPQTTQGLDPIDDRIMHRTPFRKIGNQESLLVMHTVRGSTFGVGVTRWYELRGLSGTPTIYQSGTIAPDTVNSRWMGSMAMNKDGDIAVGYSVSGPNVFPGVRVSTRNAADPLGTMHPEFSIVEGGGNQVDSFNRWGDYSCMQVDPVDDTTFWFTTQYIQTSGSFNWKSVITAFPTNPSLESAAPTISPAPTVAVTSEPTLTPDFFDVTELSPVKLSFRMNVAGYQGYCGQFSAHGSVTTVDLDVLFGGSSTGSWVSDMAVGVFSPNGGRVQIGGYNVVYSEVGAFYSFPIDWESTTAGRYTASVDIGTNSSGSGTWELCVANFWSNSDAVLYDGTATFNVLTHDQATANPTPAPTLPPPFNVELFNRLNITGYYGTKGATLVTNMDVSNCPTSVRGFRIKMPEGLIRQDGSVLNGVSHVFLRTSGDTYPSEWYSEYTLAYGGHTFHHSQNLFVSSSIQVPVSPLPAVVKATGRMVAKPHFEYGYQFLLDKEFPDAVTGEKFMIPMGASYTLTYGVYNLRPNGEVRSKVCMVYEGVNQ